MCRQVFDNGKDQEVELYKGVVTRDNKTSTKGGNWRLGTTLRGSTLKRLGTTLRE